VTSSAANEDLSAAHPRHGARMPFNFASHDQAAAPVAKAQPEGHSAAIAVVGVAAL
jgi:hypothetical protein